MTSSGITQEVQDLPVFAPHARHKMRARDVMVTDVVRVLDTGSRVLRPEHTRVEGDNGVVVLLDREGTVVTAYRVAPRRIPLERILGPDAGVGDWRRSLAKTRNRSARRLRVVP